MQVDWNQMCFAAIHQRLSGLFELALNSISLTERSTVHFQTSTSLTLQSVASNGVMSINLEWLPLDLQVWWRYQSLPASELAGEKKCKQRGGEWNRYEDEMNPYGTEFHWLGSASRKTGNVSSGANLAIRLQGLLASKDNVRGLFFFFFPSSVPLSS